MIWSGENIWKAWLRWPIMAGWHDKSRRKVQSNSLTLVECIRTGRTNDALLALDSGANPNSSDQQGQSVLCIAISLGNINVVERLLELGADVSTHYPSIEVISPESMNQRSALGRWIKQFLGEVLFRFPLMALHYTRFRHNPLLIPLERFFPVGQVVKMVVSRQPAEPRQVIETLLLPAELFFLLHLGSVYLGGTLQHTCNEALQSWSFRGCFLQVALLTYIQQSHRYLEGRLRPAQRRTPGNDALKELLAYAPDASGMAMLLLENGIDLGNSTQIGGQGHELLLWAVARGYTNVVESLLKIGVPATICLPRPDELNHSLYYRQWYNFNREPALARAVTNLQKDMVALLLDHVSGGYTPGWLNWALLECAQATPSTALRETERDEIIRMLLDHGADPNVKTDDGRSPLSYLCGHTDAAAFALLLSAGADPASTDSSGQTVLHHACFRTQGEDSTIVNTLINAGAPVNAVDNKGRTALWKVASWGRPHTALALMRQGADVELRGEGSTTPLMEACVHNGTDLVRALLACGADPNACTTDDTPLLAALRRNNAAYEPEVVQVLLDAGARPVLDLDFPRQPLVESVHALKGDWTVAVLRAAQAAGTVPHSILNDALKEACVSSRDFSIRHMVVPELSNYIALKAVKALVEAGGDVLSVVVDTCTVLHAICQSTGSSGDEEELLKAIVERDVSLDAQEQGTGRTPLHIAVRSSKIKTVKALVRLGASVAIADLESQTPLHVACQAKRRVWTRDSPYDLGEGRLSAHPQYQGLRGEAALHFELRTRYRDSDLSMAEEDAVEYLLDHGADPLAADRAGLTPLHYACKAGNPITAKRILRGRDRHWEFLGEPIRPYYSFFAVLSARDGDGRLPLHWAARSGNVEVVRALLAVDLNRSSSSIEYEGWSLPTEREEEDHAPPFLAELSSDIVNAVDNAGYTALHRAAEEGHEDIVRVLLETSVVDVLLVSASGYTVLELAAARGHDRIVKLLEASNKFRYSQARTTTMALHDTNLWRE